MRQTFALLLTLGLAVSSVFGQDSGDRPIERIAFGSCNRDYKPQPLWQPIRDCKPDLWIWLGDIVYGRADDLDGLARKYRSEKNNPGYKALRDQCRVIGVWDDNDYGVSDGGSKNPNKVQCQKLLLDFLDEPADSPRRQQQGVFAAYSFGPPGKKVKIILLDGRYNRENPGGTADMLGSEQWQWLERQLTESDADVHLIGSGVQVVAEQHPYEKWADFPRARQRLFDLIAKTRARNVIFLSGDRHLGEISRFDGSGASQPIYDITSSGLTHHATNNLFHNFNRETNRFRVGSNFVDLNFGLVQFDWNATPATAALQIRDVNNTVRAEAKFPLATR